MHKVLNKAQQIGAELVVRTLEMQGVTHVFGVPGAKIDAVFNALVDSTIKTVVCRHEQNAAFIAGGIGRMTGKAGVAIATSGPGVSNLTTGLATANSEGDPVVALGGAVDTSEALKQIHQTMDAVSILKPVTKFSATVGAPDQVSEVLANAFRAAESGRPGASYVNLPKDVMTEPCTHEPLPAPAFAGLGPADGSALKEAARLINAASNPVVLLGMLASKPANAEALQVFIGKNNLPVVGTFQAAGAVGALLFDNFGGRVGQFANQPADRLLEIADLVITVGYDPVEYWPPLWNGKSKRKIIHIDVLPADLDNCYSPYVELTGDIGQTLQALTPNLKREQKSALSSELLETISAQRKLLRTKQPLAAACRSIHCVSCTNCNSSSAATLPSAWTWVRFISGSLAISIASDLARSSSRTASRLWALPFPGALPPRSSGPRRKFSRSPGMAASSIPLWNWRPRCASKPTWFTWSGSMALTTW